jgi:hypothetical protein
MPDKTPLGLMAGIMLVTVMLGGTALGATQNRHGAHISNSRSLHAHGQGYASPGCICLPVAPVSCGAFGPDGGPCTAPRL